MLVTLAEMKQYLRVDSSDDDALISTLIDTAEALCRDVARMDEDAFSALSATAKVAVLYAVAYLYEHREEADHKALTLTLRAMLFGVREEAF